MKKTSIAVLLLVVLSASGNLVSGKGKSAARESGSNIEFANAISATSLYGTWKAFWSAFRTAVLKRDRVALKTMMTNPFDSGGGGPYTPDEWLKFIDNDLNWQGMRESVASGTKVLSGYGRAGGRSARITNNNYLVFVRGKDGQWRWAGVGGD